MKIKARVQAVEASNGLLSVTATGWLTVDQELTEGMRKVQLLNRLTFSVEGVDAKAYYIGREITVEVTPID